MTPGDWTDRIIHPHRTQAEWAAIEARQLAEAEAADLKDIADAIATIRAKTPDGRPKDDELGLLNDLLHTGSPLNPGARASLRHQVPRAVVAAGDWANVSVRSVKNLT